MAFRSLSLLGQLCALLVAIVLGTCCAREHDKAWSIMEGIRTPSYLKDFFATASSSYNATGADPSFLIAESRFLMKRGATSSDDDTKTGKGTPTTSAGGGGGKTSTSSTDDEEATTTSSVAGHAQQTDDGAYLNKTSVLPPERDQPRGWPATVLVLFLVLAAVLIGLTVYKNCKKRSQYQDVPTNNLIV